MQGQAQAVAQEPGASLRLLQVTLALSQTGNVTAPLAPWWAGSGLQAPTGQGVV